MHKWIKIFRITSIILLLFTGINAIVAGLLFIFDPSGQKMGMSTAYLFHSPFSSFLLPGITLLVVNGLFNIIAAIYCIKKHPLYPLLILLQGVFLSGWILFQVYWVRDFNGLHMTMLAIGIVLLINGLLLKKELGRT